MIDEKEMSGIRSRVFDLKHFWSMWGFTEISDMPQYMQDLCKLIEFVDILQKAEILRAEAAKADEPKEDTGLDGRP